MNRITSLLTIGLLLFACDAFAQPGGGRPSFGRGGDSGGGPRGFSRGGGEGDRGGPGGFSRGGESDRGSFGRPSGGPSGFSRGGESDRGSFGRPGGGPPSFGRGGDDGGSRGFSRGGPPGFSRGGEDGGGFRGFSRGGDEGRSSYSRGGESSRSSDGDRGRSSENSRTASVRKPRAPIQVRVFLKEDFAKLDADYDGQVAMFEWPRSMRAEFATLDVNSDGFLTPRELIGTETKAPSPDAIAMTAPAPRSAGTSSVPASDDPLDWVDKLE